MGAWDLTTSVAPVCASVKNFVAKIPSSDGKSSYRVTYGPSYLGPSPSSRYQHDWSCECVGFKTRKTCKHINLAKTQRCGWNGYLEPRPMPVDRRCPECHGELEFVQVAV